MTLSVLRVVTASIMMLITRESLSQHNFNRIIQTEPLDRGCQCPSSKRLPVIVCVAACLQLRPGLVDQRPDTPRQVPAPGRP